MGTKFILVTAFLAMLCWGFGDFFIQKNTRKEGDIETLFFIGIIGILGLLPFVLKDLPHLLEPNNLAVLGVLGVITFIAAILDFEALKKGKLSVVQVVFEIELPITIILGILFFHEKLSLIPLLMISLIFIGIVLIAFKGKRSDYKTIIEKGVILALIGAFAIAGVNFLTAGASRQISPFMAIWFPSIIFSVFCLGVIIKRKRFDKMKRDIKKFKWIILIMGVLDVLAWTFYALSVSKGELGIITAITEGYPVIGLILGVLINKEKIKLHQAMGGLFAIGATIVLAFFV